MADRDPAEVFDLLADRNRENYEESDNPVQLGAMMAYRDAARFLRRAEEADG